MGRWVLFQNQSVFKWTIINSMKTIILIFFTTVCFGQSVIIPAGNANETIGAVFPIMRDNMKPKEVSLGTPKFELPIEKPKPVVKKKLTWWQRLIKAIFG